MCAFEAAEDRHRSENPVQTSDFDEPWRLAWLLPSKSSRPFEPASGHRVVSFFRTGKNQGIKPMLVPSPKWLDTGNNAWQLAAATFVGLQSIPGLAVLYGGYVKH
jgi:hypothetical protein